MGYDLRRAATALLACLAVVLAAMLLPAAGIGSYPDVVGGPASDAGPGDGTGPGGAGPGVGDDPGTDPGSDPVDETTTTTQERETRTGGGGGTDPDETDETTTTTTTATDRSDDGGGATDPSDDDGGDGSNLLAALGAILINLVQAVVLLGLVASGVLLLGLVVGGVSAGPIRLLSRDGNAGETLLEVFGVRIPLGGLRGLSQGSLRTVIGLSRSAGTLLSGLGSAAAGVASAVASGGSLLAGVGSALTAVGSGLARATLGVGGVLASLSGGVGSIASGLSGWRPGFDRGDSPTADARGAGSVPAPDERAEETPVDPGPQSVEEAWERFVERVPVRRPDVRTPGEVARTAVERDWPADPVRRLTQTFREVRYGGVPGDEDRTDSATSALDRLDGGDRDGDGGDPQ